MYLLSVGLFASSSSGLSALGVGLNALIIQLITFVLAYLVLRKWAFGPIVKILQQRRQVIEDGVKLGDKMRSDEKELEEKIEKTLGETRIKADKIIADAEATAKQMVRDAEGEAKSRADIVIKEAEEYQKMKHDLEQS